jgi:hypothetical protein
VPELIWKKVPVVRLVHENCDSIALGTKIRDILRKYDELEGWEDRLKEYLADQIVRNDGYFKAVLQRVLDIILKIDAIQDSQIEAIVRDAFTIATINRFSNEILKPLDIQTPRPKRPQLPLWSDAA